MLNENRQRFDRTDNPESKFELREYTEEAREFASSYRGLVDYLSGEAESLPDIEMSNSVDAEKMKSFTDAVQRRLESQLETYNTAEQDAGELIAGLLERVGVSLSDEELGSIQAASKDRVPAVYIPKAIYDKMIRNGSRAVAYRPKEGASMVLLPIYKKDQHNSREHAENLPHETHHVAWEWATREGAVTNDESSPIRKSAFAMYQDEMMARAASKGSLFGYTHMSSMSEEGRRQAKEKYGEEFDDIASEVTALNEMADTIQRAIIQRETDMTTGDVGLMVFRATSFETLMSSFIQLNNSLQAIPEKPKPVDTMGGWGSVDT